MSPSIPVAKTQLPAPADEVKALGCSALAIPCDITKADMVTQVVQEMLCCDVLVANFPFHFPLLNQKKNMEADKTEVSIMANQMPRAPSAVK